MNIVKLGNGHLRVESRRAEILLEKLIDEDKLWTYISYIFNKSAEEIGTHKTKTKAEPEDKSLEEMKKMMVQVLDEMSEVRKQMKENVVIAPTVKEEVVATKAEPIKETKAPKKRRSKPKKNIGGLGSLDALASKFNKSDRR